MQNSFQLISDPSEKVKIISDLVACHGEVLVKSILANTTAVPADPILFRGSELTVKPKAAIQFKKEERALIVQFSIGAQKYISQVEFQTTGETLKLSMAYKLFRVQRRDFYRLKLPIGFRGKLFVPELNGIKFNQDFHLIDISGGGCKIELPGVEINFPPQTFPCVLKIPGRPDVSLMGVARYQHKIPVRPEIRWIGIQFVQQTEPQRNSLAALVMDLYREIFSRG